MTLQDQLIRDEGLKLKPYRDKVGKLTIGIGRNLDDVGISQKEAFMLLAADIQKAEDFLAKELPWTIDLDSVRYGVFCNMAFNLGSRLLKFDDFIAKAKAGDVHGASVAMLDSTWARQVGERALRLATQYATGIWQ